MKLSTSTSLLLAFCLIYVQAASGAPEMKGVSKGDYLDLMETAVGAYSDEHLARYLADVEKNGVQEHGFPRLAANLGVLTANGRLSGKRDLFRRMMTVCCRDAKKGVMPPKGGGNEFSVKELVIAYDAVKEAGLFDSSVTAVWSNDLASVDAWRSYTSQPHPGGGPQNWCVFGATSEQTRRALGLGGWVSFTDRYVSDQMRWLDANGMYRDPDEPIAYDFVTRLQYMQILHFGYSGSSRAALEQKLEAAAEPTLAMLSAAGEIPYGGRSNQFLHNQAIYAAVCEWYAAKRRAVGDASGAMRFRLAARRSVDAIRPWLEADPVRHIKNYYPRSEGVGNAGVGCEQYAYFDKYMVSMGSMAMIGWLFAPEGEGEALVEDPRDAAPKAFATTEHFHLVCLRAGEYSAQFDYNADTHYDCDGLGRIQRRGAPGTICLSVPCALAPNYLTETPNTRTLAIVPAGAGMLVPDGCGQDASGAWANWRFGGKRWKCRLTDEGLSSELSGTGYLALSLPAFAFDGENSTEIKCDGKTLSVDYKGWTCSYATDGEIVDTGTSVCNRNGRYRAFEARGKDSLKVHILIEPRRASEARKAADEIVVCDQKGQTIDIYDAGGSNVWRWCAKDDPGIPGGDRYGFLENVAECKPFCGGAKIGMVSCGGRWAVIDREKRRACAWGRCGGWAHSIELVGSNVVAVVSTGGAGGNTLFLFDVSGDAAMNPQKQKKSTLLFDSPHGLHYDGKSLWLVDTPGLHRCSISRDTDGAPVAKVEKTWPFSELGVIHGHDLRPVPRTALLAMTTHEKVLFFDMKTESWREDMFIERVDVKAFDPSPDGKTFLVTTAKTKWWTDSLEVYTLGKKCGELGFSPSLVVPGAKIYKARWVK